MWGESWTQRQVAQVCSAGDLDTLKKVDSSHILFGGRMGLKFTTTWLPLALLKKGENHWGWSLELERSLVVAEIHATCADEIGIEFELADGTHAQLGLHQQTHPSGCILQRGRKRAELHSLASRRHAPARWRRSL